MAGGLKCKPIVVPQVKQLLSGALIKRAADLPIDVVVAQVVALWVQVIRIKLLLDVLEIVLKTLLLHAFLELIVEKHLV